MQPTLSNPFRGTHAGPVECITTLRDRYRGVGICREDSRRRAAAEGSGPRRNMMPRSTARTQFLGSNPVRLGPSTAVLMDFFKPRSARVALLGFVDSPTQRCASFPVVRRGFMLFHSHAGERPRFFGITT